MILRASNVTRHSVLAGSARGRPIGLWAKFRGLMGRASLADETGLWLPGSNGIHMMFMRFAIDCVFVGQPIRRRRHPRGRRVHRAVAPWRGLVWYVRGAHGILELPTGTIDRTGTAPGDRIALEEAGQPR